MKATRMLVAAGCAVVLLGTAPVAFAQRGGGGHGGGGGGGGHGGGAVMSRGSGLAGGSMSRGGAIRGMGSGPMTRPRQFGGMRGPFVRGGGFAPGGSFDHRGPFVSNGGGFVHNGRFVNGGAFVAGRRFPIAPVHFFHPYYTFQPRLSLGFGLWAGYPFAYPYAFYSPFYYPDTYVNPYGDAPYSPAAAYPPAVTNSLEAQPSSDANMGGVSFDVTPSTAELFVDNTLVGTVGQFTPTTQPLGLEAGHHRVEVRAPGYQTLSFDVDIIAGQVIPYQGTLTR
jgi:PEGA domain